ncbi:hypothetical protein B0T17DRAFT_50066 [Bombardia bombarda]|uniref:Uncharacterized protein n=1 Tax=Bombardia bombarda TaxID=252184 RepID=A0AA39XKD1_9PEZI|nr:hypothetical protein B0T17DRAFT_50066 [Bombardia bombarda]
MNFQGLLGIVLALVGWLGVVTAEFTNSFDAITGGSDLLLTWDGVASQSYPLYITAQLIDKSADGKANGYRANITTSVNGNSYLWSGAPYPLRWLQSGMYQLELRPSNWTTGEPPLAKSPFFVIGTQITEGSESDSNSSSSSSPKQPTLVDYQSGTPTGVNKPLAIGLGVAFGVTSVVGLAVVSWCLRRRHRRAALVKRRLKRAEFVIN